MSGIQSPGRRTILGTVALGGLLSGCSALSPTEVALPAGATEIAIPAVYQDWHRKTEQCSGLNGNLSSIKFYVVPGVETFPTSDGAKVGEWTTDGRTNRIVLAGNYQNYEMVVRHEILHSLLGAAGHPTEYFVDRCHLTWESWNGPLGAPVALSGE